MDIQSNFSILPADSSQHQKRVNPAKDAVQKEQGTPPRPAGIVVSPASEDALKSARQFQKEADFDGVTSRSKVAISSYTSFERQSQRESVQQLFGVDIYA